MRAIRLSEADQRSRVHELGRMSRTQLIVIYQSLCDPANPDVLRERIDCRAESTRHQIIPRWLVEKEIRLLAEAAGKQIAGRKFA